MDFLAILLVYGWPFLLLLLGFSVGKYREVRHLRSLRKREEETSHIQRINLRRVPEHSVTSGGGMVCGQAVIATDYFKSFAANVRKIFGGELRTFETLMGRARREAILRMVYEAQATGADAVINIRLETSTIVRSSGRRSASTAAEVMAYGTAVKLQG